MKIPDVWTFESDSVATEFDSHVREQLPWYDLVTAGVAQIARHYVSPGGLIYDLGAATGNIGRALADLIDERHAEFVPLEASRAMIEAYRGPGVPRQVAVHLGGYLPFDLAVSMLTTMFLPPADVPAMLDRLVDKITPGGALVLVERMLPPAGYLGIVTSRITLAGKAAAGVSADDILAKELSLAGIQRPLDPALLLDRGAVEFFRFGDFAGYVIEGTS